MTNRKENVASKDHEGEGRHINANGDGSSSFSSHDNTDRPQENECEEIPSYRWLTPSFWGSSKDSRSNSGISSRTPVREFPSPEMHASSSLQEEPRVLRHFSLEEIQNATRNFHAANMISGNGPGQFYKGILSDGSTVAIKKIIDIGIGSLVPLYQIKEKWYTENFNEELPLSKQMEDQFLKQAEIISSFCHLNVIKLIGCCLTQRQVLVIYEYIEGSSLAQVLFGKHVILDWPTRIEICLGVARGLAYIHGCFRKIMHGNIHPNNIILDSQDYNNAKISDFSLDVSFGMKDYTPRIQFRGMGYGTTGYLAPEYLRHRHLTDKMDVFSLGVVMLEILGGKRATWEKTSHLLDEVPDQKERRLLELIDLRLCSQYPKEAALQILNLALLCTHSDHTKRPSMHDIVNMIEHQVVATPIVPFAPILMVANVSPSETYFEEISATSQIGEDVLQSLFSAIKAIQLPDDLEEDPSSSSPPSLSRQDAPWKIYGELKSLILQTDFKGALHPDIASKMLHLCQLLRRNPLSRHQSMMLLDELMDFQGLNSELSSAIAVEEEESSYVGMYDSVKTKVEGTRIRAMQMHEQGATLHSSIVSINYEVERIMQQIATLNQKLDALKQQRRNAEENLSRIKNVIDSDVKDVKSLLDWLQAEYELRILAGKKLKNAKKCLNEGRAKWKSVQDHFL